MGAWLVGGTPAAPVSPMGARSRFQRWPHPRLPHPCQQQGHRRDVPCWDCASGTQQCGQTGHPAIPPAIFWLIAVPTNTPNPDTGCPPRLLSLDKSKAKGSTTTCWGRAASLLRAPRGHAQPRAATGAPLQLAAPRARCPLAGILEARHCSPPAVLPWRRFLCHQPHKGNCAFPGMQR